MTPVCCVIRLYTPVCRLTLTSGGRDLVYFLKCIRTRHAQTDDRDLRKHQTRDILTHAHQHTPTHTATHTHAISCILTEVIIYAGRFHLFHSRKHVSDLNCSLSPLAPNASVVDHCVEWRTSEDGVRWQRRGILTPPTTGRAMSETMSARIYGDRWVLVMEMRAHTHTHVYTSKRMHIKICTLRAYTHKQTQYSTCTYTHIYTCMWIYTHIQTYRHPIGQMLA